ncbi:hydrolase [Sporosarcina globispora]|uniref:Hydrolase n=2 Tax=Sporosarcina globispora TaxID=1459 RepID=A0A0M0GKZ5_SPOGL|nr:hydrolase [Sporosarcina globispora]
MSSGNSRKCQCKDYQTSSNENANKCKGCICDTLRTLQTQTEVDVFLDGGQVLENVNFINLDNDTCCAFFVETEPGSTLIVDCQKIQAIRIQAD